VCFHCRILLSIVMSGKIYMDKMLLEQVFFGILLFSLLILIPFML
jgi:hypothetical protein